MLDKIKKIIEALFKALMPLLILAGMYKFFVHLGWIPEAAPAPWNWVIFGIVVILVAVLNLTVSVMHWFWDITALIPRNLWLLLLRQDILHQRVEDLHRMTEGYLFGRVAELEGCQSNSYHIVFTHKGEHPHQRIDKEYRIPGFPYDEAETVMRVWHEVAQNTRISLDRIRPLCSCDTQINPKVLNGSYTIIGSPRYNNVCRQFMDKIRILTKNGELFREHRYVMETGTKTEESSEEARAYLKGDEFTEPMELWPDSTKAPTNKPMIDYAFFMKLPNILSETDKGRRETVLVLAGCKVAGQFALASWLMNPKNLARLYHTYSSNHFYVILEVQYYYVPQSRPRIARTSVLREGLIKFKSEG